METTATPQGVIFEPAHFFQQCIHTKHKCQSTQVVSSTKWKPINQNVYPKCKLCPKELTINLCTTTHLNPLDQESERETRGHPVGFLVPMLVL